MPDARDIKAVAVPEPLTNEEIADRAAFYFMRDTTVFRALQELIQLRNEKDEAQELIRDLERVFGPMGNWDAKMREIETLQARTSKEIERLTEDLEDERRSRHEAHHG